MQKRLKWNDRFYGPEYYFIDIRSEEDYARGHIPGSISFPLLTSLASKKSHHRNKQILERSELAAAAGDWAADFSSKGITGTPVVIVCNDGGIRSEFARDALLSTHSAYILEGGYRQYRRQVRLSYSRDYPFHVLAGKTGSGKTELLHLLKRAGFQTLDLEAVAASQGSAFGVIGHTGVQPTQEQFENELSARLERFKNSEQIFVEREQSFIGRCRIPDGLMNQFLQAPKIFLRIPFEKRVGRLVEKYAVTDDKALKNGIRNLSARISREEADELVTMVEKGRYADVAGRLLAYYDHTEGYEEALAACDVVITGESIASIYEEVISIQKKTLLS